MSEENGKKESKLGVFSRRKLFSTVGFGSLFLTLGGVTTGILSYIFPRLNLEPSTKVAVGRPEDFQVGEMKMIDSAQVFIFYESFKDVDGNEHQGFQAVSTICTHLGCTYKPFRQEDPKTYGCGVYAHCPCHGSVFCRDGKNVGGPAPRPLPFFKMELSPDGRIMVDKGAVALTDELSKASGEGVAHDLYLEPGSGKMIAANAYPTGEGTDFSA